MHGAPAQRPWAGQAVVYVVQRIIDGCSGRDAWLTLACVATESLVEAWAESLVEAWAGEGTTPHFHDVNSRAVQQAAVGVR